MRTTYCDCNASTPIGPEVADAMQTNRQTNCPE